MTLSMTEIFAGVFVVVLIAAFVMHAWFMKFLASQESAEHKPQRAKDDEDTSSP